MRNINFSELNQIRNTAAFLLAAAISQTFPRARFLSGGSTSFGFYYDFIVEDVKEGQFSFIEETMANLLKEEIKTLHMTSQNAKEFFRHYGFLDRAHEIKHQGFVDLLQINNFIDFRRGGAQDIDDLLFFKLFKVEKIDERTRIFGALFTESKDLKNFLKEQKNHSFKDHLTLSEEMGLFYPLDGGLWSFKGKELKDILLNFYKNELKKENFFFIETPDVAKSFNFLLEKEKKFLSLPLKIAEIKQSERTDRDFLNPPNGFFSLNNVYILSEYILCEKAFVLQEVISSLKFFLKILKIFDFRYKVVFCSGSESSPKRKALSGILEEGLKSSLADFDVLESEAGIEIWIEDGKKWYHRGPFLRIEPFEEKIILKRSTLGVLEDFIASLLEHTQGTLPFWLNPELVRVVCVNKDCIEYGKKIKDICEKNNIRAYIDSSEGVLSAKIHDALKSKAAFIAVVGEKERVKGTVTLRNLSEIEEIDLDSLVNKLKNFLN